jgi:hypothetical protein
MKKSLPITSASRSAIWIYPRAVPPRFKGAPTIMETTRTHEMPDVEKLPEEADVAVELYGKSWLLRLDGLSNQVYTGRFESISFPDAKEARCAFASLWRTIEHLNSPDEISAAAEVWRGSSVWHNEQHDEEIIEDCINRGAE